MPQGRGLQSAYKNRRYAPDHFLPIITQDFSPGKPGPRYIRSYTPPSLTTSSLGARVPPGRGLQSAYKNRRFAPDHFLPIITQDFSPGTWGGPRWPKVAQSGPTGPTGPDRDRQGQTGTDRTDRDRAPLLRPAQHPQQLLLRTARLRTVIILPPHPRGETHQYRLRTSLRLNPKQGPPIVQQIELHITAPPDLLPITLPLTVLHSPSAFHNRQIGR